MWQDFCALMLSALWGILYRVVLTDRLQVYPQSLRLARFTSSMQHFNDLHEIKMMQNHFDDKLF